jgi:hypothetical protein
VDPVKDGLINSYVSYVYDSHESPFLPGKGILKLCGRYSYMSHIAYSLLKGRMFIIYASDKHKEYSSFKA